jgi:hypothetical protein
VRWIVVSPELQSQAALLPLALIETSIQACQHIVIEDRLEELGPEVPNLAHARVVDSADSGAHSGMRSAKIFRSRSSKRSSSVSALFPWRVENPRPEAVADALDEPIEIQVSR